MPAGFSSVVLGVAVRVEWRGTLICELREHSFSQALKRWWSKSEFGPLPFFGLAALRHTAQHKRHCGLRCKGHQPYRRHFVFVSNNLFYNGQKRFERKDCCVDQKKPAVDAQDLF